MATTKKLEKKPEETETTDTIESKDEGQRVKFSPTHNPALELVGKVVKIHEDGNFMDIEVEADGKIVEVEGHIQTVPSKQVKEAGTADKNRHLGRDT